MASNSGSMFRRNALISAAGFGGLLAADIGFAYLFWPTTPTEVMTSDQEVAPDLPRCLAIGGLGHSDAQFIVEELDEVLPGAKDSLSLSTRGITRDSVGRALAEYYTKEYGVPDLERRQNVVVHSLGFRIFLMGIDYCRRNGIAVPPIDTLIAISSPADASHTFREKQIKLMAKIPYPGGPFTKLGIEFWQLYAANQYKFATLGHTALTSWRKAYTECSPHLWGQQVRTIGPKPSVEYLSGVFTPETRFYYLGDAEEKTVRVLAAVKTCEDMVNPHGTVVNFIQTPGAGHANMQVAREMIRKHITFPNPLLTTTEQPAGSAA